MKFSTSLLTALAPVALSKSVRNHYPRDVKRSSHGGISGLNGLSGITEGSLTQVIIIWANPGGGAETTTINSQVTVTQTVVAGAGQATAVAGEVGTTTVAEGATGTVVGPGATHSVTVGGPAGLVFTPDNIKANIGDMVIFEFLSQNHSATQSAFDTPCDPLSGGMDSGFQANPNNTVSPAPQVAMQVMVDTPLWFFCAQNGHCGKGMTFSINPTAEKTQAMFQSMAIAQKGKGAGSAITGGEGAPAAGAGNAASSAASPPAGGESTTLAQLPGAAGAASQTLGEVASPTGSIVQGTGTVLPDGSCSCAVVVGSGAFPAVGVQGVGAYGGMANGLPMAMAEA
jgi:plastocyanin